MSNRTEPLSMQLFQPEETDVTLREQGRLTREPEMVAFARDGVIVPEGALDSIDAWMLSHAMRHSNVRDIYADGAGSEGAWYEEMGRVLMVEPYGLINGVFEDLRDVDPEPGSGDGVVRPEHIELRVVIARGDRARRLTIPADVAIVGEPSPNGDEIGLFVAQESEITVDDLTELVESAAFEAWEDTESDSWDFQHYNFVAEVRARATGILASREEEVLVRVREALRPLPYVLGGRGVVIRVGAQGEGTGDALGSLGEPAEPSRAVAFWVPVGDSHVPIGIEIAWMVPTGTAARCAERGV